MKASYFKHVLEFIVPAGTSRGVMTQKESWFIVIDDGGRRGIGECGLLRGLSIDDRSGFEEKLAWVCDNIQMDPIALDRHLTDWPSIRFGVEAAFLSLQSEDPMVLYPSPFTSGQEGIPINGLIWMGDPDHMRAQVSKKIEAGFRCLKMKIGAIDFNQELKILEEIRVDFPPDALEIRVDANGAFDANSALDKIEQLSGFEIHSIEQPIAPKKHDRMAEIVKRAGIPIALDEELIGINHPSEMRSLMEHICPHYIILKPSLLGGFAATKQWIALAEELGIGWWITSALESSVGLNAIAQFTHALGVSMPQGLGTGALYTNNIASPLEVRDGKLWYGNGAWESLVR